MDYSSRKLRTLVAHAVADCFEGEAVGAALSGGIDSSVITSIAKNLMPDLPTFTGWYDHPGCDERHFAHLVAGDNHHDIEITPYDFVRHFDGMLDAVQPPLQGPGTFGQYMVARAAANHIDTVLSGEGGDELFGGYARLLKVAGEPMPPGYDHYQPPEDYPDTVEDALEYDMVNLPDLLAVDDQMAGAWGLTARAPFTDPPVVEYVLSCDPEQRVGKRMLRESFLGIVPNPILRRQDKRGFPVPFVAWAQENPVRDFLLNRIGYVPDPAQPYSRQWWQDLCQGVRV